MISVGPPGYEKNCPSIDAVVALLFLPRMPLVYQYRPNSEAMVCARSEMDSRGEPQPSDSVYLLAKAFKNECMLQLEMYRLYEEYRAKHQDDADPAIYDAILDTMDCIVGWGNRSNWIFDQELDRSFYDKAFMKNKGQA
jgi:hypothetical protein